MTYAELTGLLENYLENQEAGFVADIPQIVQQGEARIHSKIRVLDQRKTGSGATSTAAIAAPSDLIEVLYMLVGGTPLMQRQKSFLRTVYGDTTGTPESYALDNTAGSTTVLIAPAPTGSVSYELSYTGTPTSIVTAGTTYLSLNFPECLLYACLLEACVYCKGEKMELDVFQARFTEALGDLQRSAEGLQLQDEYRNQPERVAQ